MSRISRIPLLSVKNIDNNPNNHTKNTKTTKNRCQENSKINSINIHENKTHLKLEDDQFKHGEKLEHIEKPEHMARHAKKLMENLKKNEVII